MRVLLISDIHANPLALEAVLHHAGPVDQTWCLGDIVGYGPLPNEAVDMVRSIPNLSCVAGNHDLALAFGDDIENFNPEAQKAIAWQKGQLTKENIDFLGQLPHHIIPTPDIYVAHGSPQKPTWGYILTNQSAKDALEFSPLDHNQKRFVICGHTHYQSIFLQREGQELDWIHLEIGTEYTLHGRAVINPGSVGQPRDRDNRAAYAIFDPATGAVTPHRVQYNIDSVIQLIQNCEALPPNNANRLIFGT